jgi:hypothetical protein
VRAGDVLKQRVAEQVVDVAAGVLDRSDRVAGGLRGSDRAGEDELGGVVDDVPGAPRPAATGLEFEEVGLPAVRSALDLGVDGFVASAGHHVHELCLGFRVPSLSLKPLSEGRYDHIALVPLDFRPPERHARKSTPGSPGALLQPDSQRTSFRLIARSRRPTSGSCMTGIEADGIVATTLAGTATSCLPTSPRLSDVRAHRVSASVALDGVCWPAGQRAA